MEKTNLLTLVVTLTVGIILAGSLLMPVITDATTTEKTFENLGYFNMSEISDNTDVTITWDHTKPTVFTINDSDYDITVPSGQLVSILGTDSMIVRYVSSYDGTQNRVQAYSAQGFVQASVANAKDMTIEISNNTVVVTVDDTVKTVNITEGYHIDPNGTWVMKKANESAYIHKTDSVMIFAGITNMGAGLGDVGVYATGTINDGMDIGAVPTSSTPPTATFGDVTFNYTAISGYTDLVSLSNCTFDITLPGTPDTTVTASYSYFIVPVNVTAELTQHLDAGEIALLNALPVLVIIGLVLAGVGAIFIRNRD